MLENFIRCAAVRVYNSPYNDSMEKYGYREIPRILKTFYGKRHPEIFMTIGKYEKYDAPENCAQGFADKDWNFLTRSEAYKVAKEANQLLKDTGSRGVLYSEDIY